MEHLSFPLLFNHLDHVVSLPVLSGLTTKPLFLAFQWFYFCVVAALSSYVFHWLFSGFNMRFVWIVCLLVVGFFFL